MNGAVCGVVELALPKPNGVEGVLLGTDPPPKVNGVEGESWGGGLDCPKLKLKPEALWLCELAPLAPNGGGAVVGVDEPKLNAGAGVAAGVVAGEPKGFVAGVEAVEPNVNPGAEGVVEPKPLVTVVPVGPVVPVVLPKPLVLVAGAPNEKDGGFAITTSEQLDDRCRLDSLLGDCGALLAAGAKLKPGVETGVLACSSVLPKLNDPELAPAFVVEPNENGGALASPAAGAVAAGVEAEGAPNENPFDLASSFFTPEAWSKLKEALGSAGFVAAGAKLKLAGSGVLAGAGDAVSPLVGVEEPKLNVDLVSAGLPNCHTSSQHIAYPIIRDTHAEGAGGLGCSWRFARAKESRSRARARPRIRLQGRSTKVEPIDAQSRRLRCGFRRLHSRCDCWCWGWRGGTEQRGDWSRSRCRRARCRGGFSEEIRNITTILLLSGFTQTQSGRLLGTWSTE